MDRFRWINSSQRLILADLVIESQSAASIIQQTAERTGHEKTTERLGLTARRIRYLAQALTEHVGDRRRRMKPAAGWALDPRWSPIALAVATDKPTVLLALALTTLRTLLTVYSDALVERWPARMRRLLAGHVLTLGNEIEALTGAREELDRETDGEGVGSSA